MTTLVWCVFVLTVLRIGAGLSLLACLKYPRVIKRSLGGEQFVVLVRIALAAWCAWVLLS